MAGTQLNEQGLPASYHFKPDWEVTPRDTRKMLDEGANLLVIDVRLKPEWDFAHIKGSVLVPLDELEARAGEICSMVEENPGCSVVTLCHHGVRSLKAAAFLREQGVPNVKSIAGGLEAWSLGADTSVPRYERQGAKVWAAGSIPG
ncbi:MAG: rhodanese-like domain-containing protein [Planctomycetes bacterium]|nr:rhodanese-like domain-containing protein [Planctomycetota bacterium]